MIMAGRGVSLNSSRLLWRTFGTLGLLATLLFAAGFVYAVRDVMDPRPGELAPAPEAPPSAADNPLNADKIQIVALGDSLTRGTGDGTGQGYVGRVKEQLARETGKPVYVLANYSVIGYKTDQLLNDITNRSGVSESVAKANLILLTIGGNDLFGFATNNGNPLGGGQADINPELARQKMAEAAGRLQKILSRLAELNPRADILYIGLYNPFRDLDKTGQASLVVDEWNRKAFEIANAYPNMIVVPTFDLFEKNLRSYLYTDHFHPNPDGYQRIADRIMEVLR